MKRMIAGLILTHLSFALLAVSMLVSLASGSVLWGWGSIGVMAMFNGVWLAMAGYRDHHGEVTP